MATDKEYLTFCNASNLDWQYVKLGKETRGKDYRYPYLSELLDPTKFIKRDEHGKFIEYTYMTDVKNEGKATPEQKKIGLEEMRSKAGVLMNYLQECGKNSKEGDFLKEWEVIYAADSYKAYADYLEDMGVKTYPTREDVEKAKRKNYYIDIVVSVIDNGVTIFNGYASVTKMASKDFTPKLFDKIKTETITNTANAFNWEPAAYANLVRLYGKDVIKNKAKGEAIKTLIKNFPSATKETAKVIGKGWEDRIEKKAELDVSNSYIKFSRKISFTTEVNFKVLVLKKNNEIVIAFNDKKINNTKGLPIEIDLIRVVITKIMREHKGNILLTGFNEGAHIASLVNLYYNSNFKEHYYYTESSDYIKKLINYTVEDYSDDYQSNLKIEASFLGSVFKEIGIGSFFWLILTEGNPYGFVFLLLSTFGKKGVSAFFKWAKSKTIESSYNCLIEEKYIVSKYEYSKGNFITGYVVDKIYKNDYLEFKDVNKNVISVFSGHMLYLKLETKQLSLEKDNNGYYFKYIRPATCVFK